MRMATAFLLLASACGGRSTLTFIEPAPSQQPIGADATALDDGMAAIPRELDASAADGAAAETLDGMADATANDASEAIEEDVLWCGDVQAVPTCVEYQNLLATCLRPVPFACQSSLLPVGDADVQAITQLCLENLQRLQTACR